jgi:hypothetical protein
MTLASNDWPAQTAPPTPGALLTGKELAAAVGRSPHYVSMARRYGFRMIGGMATVAELRAWLAENPGFTVHAARLKPPRYPQRTPKGGQDLTTSGRVQVQGIGGKVHP